MFRIGTHQGSILAFALVTGLVGTTALAQDPNPPAKTADQAAVAAPAAPQAKGADAQAPDPMKRPIDAKKKKQQQKDFSKEIKGPYKKWLDEDVIYIITDEEKSAFKQLSNDEERDQF